MSKLTQLSDKYMYNPSLSVIISKAFCDKHFKFSLRPKACTASIIVETDITHFVFELIADMVEY